MRPQLLELCLSLGHMLVILINNKQFKARYIPDKYNCIILSAVVVQIQGLCFNSSSTGLKSFVNDYFRVTKQQLSCCDGFF